MHVYTAALALAAGVDWSYVIHQSPARIIAISTAVYAFLQGVKQFIPLLSGWWAIAVNVIFSAAALFVVTPADQIFTPATLASLVVAVLGAAGIHGTVSKLAQSGQTPAPVTPSGMGAKGLAILLAAGASLAIVTLTGCNNFERDAFQTLSASQAVINQSQADYESGAIAKTQAAYAAINKAKAMQVLAVQAMATYENIKATKGTESALAAQQQVVTNFLTELPALVTAVKALYSSTPATTGMVLMRAPAFAFA